MSAPDIVSLVVTMDAPRLRSHSQQIIAVFRLALVDWIQGLLISPAPVATIDSRSHFRRASFVEALMLELAVIR